MLPVVAFAWVAGCSSDPATTVDSAAAAGAAGSAAGGAAASGASGNAGAGMAGKSGAATGGKSGGGQSGSGGTGVAGAGTGGGAAGKGGVGGAPPLTGPCPKTSASDDAYSYSVPTAPPGTPDPLHQADVNIKNRGWVPTGGVLGLIQNTPAPDPIHGQPRLHTIFPDGRIPTILANYKVKNWDWNAMKATDPMATPEVSMVGFGTTPGEEVLAVWSKYVLAAQNGKSYGVMLLYIDDDSITYHYTPEDNIIKGYTIHVFDVCPDPRLKAVYDKNHAAGRVVLPATVVGTPLGRSRGSELQVVIRDTGSFMDPRGVDWWEAM